MASAVEIVNNALVQLGATPIDSFQSSQKHAIAANTIYNLSRRSLLRSHPWNFAIKRSGILAPLSTAPKSRYNYQYQIPNDCIRLLTVLKTADYKVEGDRILTDETNLQIKYVSDVSDTNLFDDSFTNLLMLKLKADLAYTVTNDREMKKLAIREYENALQIAMYHDASEDIEDQFAPYDHVLTTVRY
jgi:hypothetical protein